MSASTLKLHRIIWGWVVLVGAFAVTLPIAMLRVSQTEKFTAQPLNSWTCQGQEPGQRQVITFDQCAQLEVDPLPAASPAKAQFNPSPAAKVKLKSLPAVSPAAKAKPKS